MGALFFCTYSTRGAVSDSLVVKEEIAPPPADSLRMRRRPFMQEDTIRIADVDTIQQESIVQNDTIYTPSKKELRRMFADHSPHKATIYSAVLPGLGQAYNRKYWKIPIIYSAGFALYYGFGWMGFQDWGWGYYNDMYNEFKKLYEQEYYDPGGDDAYEDLYQRNMSYARQQRDLITIFMAILYVANVVDAMADAHFYNFDISDDLSLNVSPHVNTPNPYLAYNDYSLGLKLRLNF